MSELNRITDYPEATELSADDYVFIDNGTNSKKYLASKMGGGGSAVTYERLCYAVYVGDDVEELPTMQTLTQDSKFSEYLSYSSSTGKFTVLKDFDAFFVPWVYQFSTPSGSYAYGSLYINDIETITFHVSYKRAGDTAGYPVIRHMTQGETFYSYTPFSDGFPQQMLKVYMIKGASTSYISDLQTMIEMTDPPSTT